MELFEIEKIVKDHIKENPKSASKILRYVSEALDKYEIAVKQERESKTYNMLSMSMGYFSMKKSKAKRKFKVPALIDTLHYLFPRGSYINSGNCQADKTLLFDFLDTSIEQNYLEDHKEWLLECKGLEVYDWLSSITKEYLKEKTNECNSLV